MTGSGGGTITRGGSVSRESGNERTGMSFNSDKLGPGCTTVLGRPISWEEGTS